MGTDAEPAREISTAEVSTGRTTRFELAAGSVEEHALRLGRETLRSYPGVGGVVTFEGRVRNHHDGRRVRRLAYTVYHELANSEGRSILAEAAERFDLSYALAIHAHGELEIGDMAVWVQAAGAHRQEAFDACRWIIDEIKVRLPIWKDEYYEDGSRGWVHASV